MGLFSKKKNKEVLREISSRNEKDQIVKSGDVEIKETREKKQETKKVEKRKNVKKLTKKEGLKKAYGEAYRHIVRPLVSEKVSFLGMNNQYAFEVFPKSNKVEIKKAVKTLYGVEPIKVNIIKVRGKKVRSGRKFGTTKNWKKAIITLKSGDKIEVYEGV